MVKKILFPVSFVLIFVLIIFLGIVVTESVNKNSVFVQEEDAKIELLTSFYGEKASSYDMVETSKKLTTGNQIKRIYEGAKTKTTYDIMDGETFIGRMYLIESSHKTSGDNAQTLTIMVAYEGSPKLSSVTLKGYKVMESEAGDYYTEYSNKIGKTFVDLITSTYDAFWKPADITQKTYMEDYRVITGATYSSQAIANALLLGRKQIYDDCGMKVPEPEIQAKLVSVEQSKSDINVTNTFNAVVSFKSERYTLQDINVVYSYDYSNSTATIQSCSITELDAKESAAIIKAFSLPKVYMTSAVTVSNEVTYTVKSVNEFSIVLVAVVKMNTTTHQIIDIDLTQNTTFDSRGISYNPSELESGLESDINSMVNVSGSTKTTDAFKDAVKYAVTWEGGRN